LTPLEDVSRRKGNSSKCDIWDAETFETQDVVVITYMRCGHFAFKTKRRRALEKEIQSYANRFH